MTRRWASVPPWRLRRRFFLIAEESFRSASVLNVATPRILGALLGTAGALDTERSVGMSRTLVLLLLIGCASPPTSDGTSPADTEVSGPGTISGSFGGRSFDAVGASFRIGAPDDPARTMVIFVFDKALSCDDVSGAGWDAKVADQTQSLEIKVVGKDAGDYPLASGRTPGPGESDVNYTLTSTTGTPAETSAKSGHVTIDSAAADAATGSFDLTFPGGDTLQGSFDAVPCAHGSEP